MSKQNTRAIIDANIKQNGQQLITGQVLNATLNAMVTDYAEQAALDGLKGKVDALALGAFYGYFPDSASLPTDVTTPGYAYVGTDNPYAIWNFNGTEWSDSGTSIDMNDADEEDITRNADGKLQFKDRDNTEGMGYVILRKDKTFGEQITGKPNTIFEIRYDFDLGGETRYVPTNCVLKFNGGSIDNGILIGQKTMIDADVVRIFGDNLQVSDCVANEAYIEWFGGVSDDSSSTAKTKNNDAFAKTLSSFAELHFVGATYNFNETVIDLSTISGRRKIFGRSVILGLSFRYNIKQDNSPYQTSLVANYNLIFDGLLFSGNTTYPIIITATPIKITNCNFSEMAHCIGYTPYYVDSIWVDSCVLWLCDNFLSCFQYDGTYLSNGGYYGDWFYFNNCEFDYNTIVMKKDETRSVSAYFTNCLHGRLELAKDYYSTMQFRFTHCHNESENPAIYCKDSSQIKFFLPNEIVFDQCYFYSTAIVKDIPCIYNNCVINRGNNQNFGVIQNIEGKVLVTNASAKLFFDTNKLAFMTGKQRTPAIVSGSFYNSSNTSSAFKQYTSARSVSYAFGTSDESTRLKMGGYVGTLPFSATFNASANSAMIVNTYINRAVENEYVHLFKKEGDVVYRCVFPASYLVASDTGRSSTHLVLVDEQDGCFGYPWEVFTGSLTYTA